MKQRDLSEEREDWPVQIGAPDDGRRLDVLLAERLRFGSRTQHRDLIRAGRVRIYEDWAAEEPAEVVKRPARRVRAGELVVLQLDSPSTRGGPADTNADPLGAPDLVYEDEHLLIADKPSGIAVHPTRRHPSGSLLERIHRMQGERGDADRATPCHRLDRETSGLVLCARNGQARRRLGALFERLGPAHALRKLYLAVVCTTEESPADEFEIRLPLGPDPVSAVPIRRAVRSQDELDRGVAGVQSAHTRWRTLERHDGRALIELEPLTGRQHQLRVHAAALGHRILGDALYGAEDPERQDALFFRAVRDELTAADQDWLGSPRLALHAARLRFPHPVTGEVIEVQAPTPPLFSQLLHG